MPWAITVTGSPKPSPSPSLGGWRPEIKASVVDLPQPVGPTTAQNSPGSTAISRSRSAVNTAPDGVRNRLVTPRSSMAGGISFDSGGQGGRAQAMRSLWPFWSFWSWWPGRWNGLRSRGILGLKTRLPLAYQILAFQVAIILLSALMGVGAAVWQASQGLDMQYEQRSLAIAQSVASNSAVQDALLNRDPAGLIQKTAEQIRKSTGATYVVVTDRDGIRYSHPNPAMIGKPVDENPATVLAGNTWVGVQQGTLGISARGKAPIFHEGNVIGLVSVGFLPGGLTEGEGVLWAGARALAPSRRAIRVRGGEIGHVATLRDSTELTGLPRGLGVDSLPAALRARAHWFANRLHTIAGLVQM